MAVHYARRSPTFGGKSKVAAEVWSRFGDVPNYVEPFFGSGAVLLARPHAPSTETINDADGFVANFWRAVQADPEAVARFADWPVNECDLHARHRWLVTTGRKRLSLLMDDPDFYDTRVAGWWVWGLCQWIGSGWCNSERQSIQLPHLSGPGKGIHSNKAAGRLLEVMCELSVRLRRVRIACGDWSRVVTSSVTEQVGTTAILLDPPYAVGEREGGLYSTETECSAAVREWAIANGNNPKLRIALCGYDTEHGGSMPEGWVCWRLLRAADGLPAGAERRPRVHLVLAALPESRRVWRSLRG